MRLTVVVAAALCVCNLAAHADTVNTFTVNAPLSDGGLFTATLTYDVTKPLLSTLVGSTTNSSFAGTVNATATSQVFGLVNEHLEFFEDTGVKVDIANLGTRLTPSSFCIGSIASNSCNGITSNVGGAYFLNTSTLVPYVAPPVSVTPEPSSFVLLGTGVLGVAGVLRKRFA